MNEENFVYIPMGTMALEGILDIPKKATGIVLFAHGSGSSRFSSRNTFVAKILQRAHFATLLVDLLTEKEDEVYDTRFNIILLTERLIAITHWLQIHPKTKDFSIGLFGASTGAAAALKAAAALGPQIKAVVSRGGRPDLADEDLESVASPALLIVGGKDYGVIELNEQAYQKLACTKKLAIVEGATHLFEEPGALEEVARLATNWFKKYLTERGKE